MRGVGGVEQATTRQIAEGLDLLGLEVSMANLMSLGDPAVVWRWSWRRFCGYWCRVLDEGARRQIEEEERERERRRDELLAESRASAGL